MHMATLRLARKDDARISELLIDINRLSESEAKCFSPGKASSRVPGLTTEKRADLDLLAPIR